MKFLNEFRDPVVAARLVQQIRSVARQPWVIMEVCGGQTHSLLRHGIDQELHGVVELIHGPGCPVCVTDLAAIDMAQKIAKLPEVMLASFGDMLRVPGSCGSLLTARAEGAHVMTVYSPLDAVIWAQQHPNVEVVFFAVGFETTIPSTALAVLQAQHSGLRNFSVLAAHVRVLPAMEALMKDPNNRVQAFLAAGHVCVITGYDHYDEFSRRFRVPVVVTGFEPVDILQGILECVTQLEKGVFEVQNSYGRGVDRHGNRDARHIVETVYEVADQTWRGFGIIPGGGYRLRKEFEHFDARKRFEIQLTTDPPSVPMSLPEHPCRAGSILSGRLKPCDCPEFATTCTPDSPLGSPMVSSEGACAAYFRYQTPPDNKRYAQKSSDGATL